LQLIKTLVAFEKLESDELKTKNFKPIFAPKFVKTHIDNIALIKFSRSLICFVFKLIFFAQSSQEICGKVFLLLKQINDEIKQKQNNFKKSAIL